MSHQLVSLDPSLPMREVLKRYPGAQRALFRKYHVGGCSSCGFSQDETLAELCGRNEQMNDIQEVLNFLEVSQNEDRQMQITPQELNAAMNSGNLSNVKLLDIRTREEFEAVHLAGSELFSQEKMQDILMNWPREEGLIAVIDHQGAKSLDAAAYISGHGFKNVRALVGGIDAWSQEVDPDIPRYQLEEA